MFSLSLEHLPPSEDTYPALHGTAAVSLPYPLLEFKSLESRDQSYLYISYRPSAGRRA